MICCFKLTKRFSLLAAVATLATTLATTLASILAAPAFAQGA